MSGSSTPAPGSPTNGAAVSAAAAAASSSLSSSRRSSVGSVSAVASSILLSGGGLSATSRRGSISSSSSSSLTSSPAAAAAPLTHAMAAPALALRGAPGGIAISGAPAPRDMFTSAKFAIMEIGGKSGITLNNAVDKTATEANKKLTADGIQTVVEFAAVTKGISLDTVQGFCLKLGSNILELYVPDASNPLQLKTIKISCNELKKAPESDSFKQALSSLHDKSRRIKGYEGVQVDFVKELDRRASHQENVGLSTSGNEVKIITDLKLKQITAQDAQVIQKCLVQALGQKTSMPLLRFDQVFSSASAKRKKIKETLEQLISSKHQEKDRTQNAQEKDRLSKQIEDLHKLYTAFGGNLSQNEANFVDVKTAIALYARLYNGADLSLVEKRNLIRALTSVFLNSKISSVWSALANKLSTGNTLGIYHPGYIYDPSLSQKEKDHFKSESATQVAFETVSLLFDIEKDAPIGSSVATRASAEFVHEQYAELAHEFKTNTTSEDVSDLLFKIEANRYLQQYDPPLTASEGAIFDTLIQDLKLEHIENPPASPISVKDQLVDLFKIA